MKISLFTTVALTMPVFTHAEIIRGAFSYISSGFNNGSIVAPGYPSESPAIFIFDTDDQRLKIYNFIENDLSSYYSIGDFRAFYVYRREGNEPIETIEELTDFSIVEWGYFEEHEEGCYEEPFTSGFTIDEDGYWSYETTGWCFVIPPSGWGQITEFHDINTDIISQMHFSIDVSEEGNALKFKIPVGYKFSLLKSRDLSDWEPVGLSLEGSKPLTDPTQSIGTGSLHSIATDDPKVWPNTFYKLVISNLEIND